MLACQESFLAAASGKRIVVFLDYDGTLTPIVQNPDAALLAPAMREVVRAVSYDFPTAVISGRSRAKVEEFVRLSTIFYAGSHGLDIRGPAVRVAAACLAAYAVGSACSDASPGPRPRRRALVTHSA